MEPNYDQPQPFQDQAYEARVKLIKRLGAMLAVVAAIFIVTAIYNTVVFRVVSTNPKTSEVSDVAPFFKINFNKGLSASSVSLDGTKGLVKSYHVDGKVLTIVTNEPLTVGKQYTITLRSIAAASGGRITNRQFIFTAQNIPFGKLPKDQQATLNAKDNDSNVAVTQDPILQYLPHSTLDYNLDAIYPADKQGATHMELQAQLLIAPGVTGSEEAADVANYKQEVLSYIQSLGFDPSKYTIQYPVVNESLNGL